MTAADPLLDLWRQYQDNQQVVFHQDEGAAELKEALNLWSARCNELEEAITATPAQSLDGLRVKLQLLRSHIYGPHDMDAEQKVLVDAVLADFNRLQLTATCDSPQRALAE